MSQHILMLLPRLNAGGAERIAIALCYSIVGSGNRVTLCAANGVLLDALPKHPNFNWIDLPLHRKGLLSGYKARQRLRELIKTDRPDVIHSHSRWPSWIARKLAQKESIPFVTTAHAVHGHSNFLKRAYSGIQQKGEPWIAVSDFVAHENKRIYWHLAEGCKSLPIGADLSRLDRDEEAVIKLRQKFGVKPLVLVPTRISSAYDLEVVCKALSRIEQPLTLLFNGGAKNDQSLKALQDLCDQLPASIEAVIEQNDETFVPALYAADLAIVSNKKAGAFGMVIAEAQAVGCPVFATALGGAVEQIDNPDAEALGSRLFAKGDEQALFILIQNFLSSYDPALRDENHKKVSVQNLRKAFNLETHLAGTLAIYQSFAKSV